MWGSLLLLLAELAGYLHERARNYRLITLIQLYENLESARRGIVLLVSGARPPDGAELRLASKRLADLEKLAAEFSDPEEVHSAGGNGDRDGAGAGGDGGTDPKPVGGTTRG